jgi:hypothetical protein
MQKNFSFVSSSNREGSQFHDAMRNFGNEKHEALIKDAEALGSHAEPGIGEWHDGSEESVMLTGPHATEHGDELGRKYGQKAVAHFSATEHGPDRLWHFPHKVTRSQLASISPHFTKTRKGGYIIDEGSQLDSAAASALGGKHVPGRGFVREL